MNKPLEHPAVCLALRTGFGRLPPSPGPCCPWCGASGTGLFRDGQHRVLGCEACMDPQQAWDTIILK